MAHTSRAERSRSKPASPVNAMTVDVEEYFHVSAFEGYIDPSDWSRLPSRVRENTTRLLELFSLHGTKATFFIRGWVAERFPDLVRQVVDSGHECDDKPCYERYHNDASNDPDGRWIFDICIPLKRRR